MSANTGNWARNGVKRVRLGPLNTSNQQGGNHKGLLERLNSAGQENRKAVAPSCPEKPRYVDVTAAFFGKQRRPAQEIKSQMPPPQPPIARPVQQHQLPPQDLQEAKSHEKQGRPVSSESPAAKELRDKLTGAVASSYFFFFVLCICFSIMGTANRTNQTDFLLNRQCLD